MNTNTYRLCHMLMPYTICDENNENSYKITISILLYIIIYYIYNLIIIITKNVNILIVLATYICIYLVILRLVCYTK